MTKNNLKPRWCDTNDPCVWVLTVPVLSDNYSYLITNGSDLVLVDPADSDIIFTTIEQTGLHLSAILITHEHHDHIGGVKKAVQQWGRPDVYAPINASLPVSFTGIADSGTIRIGNFVFNAIVSPGHYVEYYDAASADRNIAWYCEHAGVVFTGDTLFTCGYGYTTDNNVGKTMESLRMLRELPEKTLLFCGHEYSLLNTSFALSLQSDSIELSERLNNIRTLLDSSLPAVPTSIEFEKKCNPFLRWDDPELRKRLNCTADGELETFMLLRERKRKFNTQWK
jgi:hydroxyacylglutathione hydrolase